MEPDESFTVRASRFAALGDPARLAVVDLLANSDRSPQELQVALGLSSNLLAHHLDVLEHVGIVVRGRSSGDGRRRYVHLITDAFADLVPRASVGAGAALFICTANSARSQLAAALWTSITGVIATSAGTHPTDRVHPRAVDAARRAGLDLAGATPRLLGSTDSAALVVTVCDRAHEELRPGPGWWHWSIPDPVADGTRAAFDRTVDELTARITALVAA